MATTSSSSLSSPAHAAITTTAAPGPATATPGPSSSSSSIPGLVILSNIAQKITRRGGTSAPVVAAAAPGPLFLSASDPPRDPARPGNDACGGGGGGIAPGDGSVLAAATAASTDAQSSPALSLMRLLPGWLKGPSSAAASASHPSSSARKGDHLDDDKARRQPRLILGDLSTEIQLLIVRHLEFADMERLRRTCHFYRAMITPELVWSVFAPNTRHVLLSHCYICLLHDPGRTRLLWPDRLDPRYPLASRCVDCAAREDEFSVGFRYALGNFASAWVCRWCGYPVPAEETPTNKQEFEFHAGCYHTYNFILMIYFQLGCVQAVCNLVACALSWRAYGHMDKPVLALTLVAFFGSVWCFLMCAFRSGSGQTYHVSLPAEFVCLGCWAAIAYLICRDQSAVGSRPHIGKGEFVALLVFIGINLFFRLLNCIGNVVLFFRPRLWRRAKPGLSVGWRIFYGFAMFFAAWTYPQVIQQEYPGHRTCC